MSTGTNGAGLENGQTGHREKEEDFWTWCWKEGQTDFHLPEVNSLLEKHVSLLFPDGPTKVFVPLCGMTVDMMWLAGRGAQVVGADKEEMAAQSFFANYGLEHTKGDVPGLRDRASLYRSNDDRIRIYHCGLSDMNECEEGPFSAVWDRAALVAFEHKQMPWYANIIKGLLAPNGRCLVEITDYDTVTMKKVEGPTGPPPPYRVTVGDLRKLYEPECTVELIDTDSYDWEGETITVHLCLIKKK